MKLSTWFKIINLDEGNIRHQSIRTGLTYNHIWNIYKHLHKCGIIRMEQVGREYKLYLTELGESLKQKFQEIEDLIGGIDYEGAKKLNEV